MLVTHLYPLGQWYQRISSFAMSVEKSIEEMASVDEMLPVFTGEVFSDGSLAIGFLMSIKVANSFSGGIQHHLLVLVFPLVVSACCL